MDVFKKLNIKKGDNITASKATIGGTEFKPFNSFRVTGIDKGFYWGQQRNSGGIMINGYKIKAIDIIEILGPTIVNRDIDPYGEEDWDLR